MLREIGLRNFKAFGNNKQVLPLSKINLIYGPNSSGKSSIIQSLLLLKQSDEYRGNTDQFDLIPRGELVDLGGFSSMLHRHETSERIMEIEIKFGIGTETNTIDFIFAGNDHESDSPRISEIRYKIHDENIAGLDVRIKQENNSGRFVWKNEESIKSYIQYAIDRIVRDFVSESHRVARRNREYRDLRDHSTILRHAIRNRFRNIRNISSRLRSYNVQEIDIDDTLESFLESMLSESSIVNASVMRSIQSFGQSLPTQVEIPDIVNDNEILDGKITYRFQRNPDSSYEDRQIEISDPTDVIEYFEVGFGSIYRDFTRTLSSISYLGPVIDDPARYYRDLGVRRASVGTRGEHTYGILSHSPTLRTDVNRWFKTFGISYELQSPQRTGNVLTGVITSVPLKDTRTNTIVTPVDVGFGISQVLPIIVEGLTSVSSIICIEQPEIHIHPRLQAELAELVIETSQEGTGRRRSSKQWIIETHSELLIRRIQRRINEGVLSPGDVSVIYVNPGDRIGSTIEVLEIDDEGDFTNEWPHGFFEEGFNEIIGY